MIPHLISPSRKASTHGQSSSSYPSMTALRSLAAMMNSEHLQDGPGGDSGDRRRGGRGFTHSREKAGFLFRRRALARRRMAEERRLSGDVVLSLRFRMSGRSAKALSHFGQSIVSRSFRHPQGQLESSKLISAECLGVVRRSSASCRAKRP